MAENFIKIEKRKRLYTPGVANRGAMRQTWRIAWLEVAYCMFKMKINEV